MTKIDFLKKKYSKRKTRYGVARFPPGGEDVLMLISVFERLVYVVKDIQRRLPEKDQNEIESQLWSIECM